MQSYQASYQTQNKAQRLAAFGHVSASSQSLRFILSLRMTSSFITSRPGVLQISTISSFRWLAVGFSIAATIIVVQFLDVSKLDRSNELQEDPSIAAEDLQGINERIKFDIETIRAKRINVHVEKRTFSANRSEGNRY